MTVDYIIRVFVLYAGTGLLTVFLYITIIILKTPDSVWNERSKTNLCVLTETNSWYSFKSPSVEKILK